VLRSLTPALLQLKRLLLICFQVEKNTTLVISGSDKCLVGDLCATIRRQRPPEPYKGKGIRYQGEVIKLKEGKVRGRMDAWAGGVNGACGRNLIRAILIFVSCA